MQRKIKNRPSLFSTVLLLVLDDMTCTLVEDDDIGGIPMVENENRMVESLGLLF